MNTPLCFGDVFDELYSFSLFRRIFSEDIGVDEAFKMYLSYIGRQIRFLRTFKSFLEKNEIPFSEIQKMQLKGIPEIDAELPKTPDETAECIAVISSKIEKYLAISELYKTLERAETTNDLPFWPGFWTKISSGLSPTSSTWDGISLSEISMDESKEHILSLNPEEYIFHRVMIVWRLLTLND